MDCKTSVFLANIFKLYSEEIDCHNFNNMRYANSKQKKESC